MFYKTDFQWVGGEGSLEKKIIFLKVLFCAFIFKSGFRNNSLTTLIHEIIIGKAGAENHSNLNKPNSFTMPKYFNP